MSDFLFELIFSKLLKHFLLSFKIDPKIICNLFN